MCPEARQQRHGAAQRIARQPRRGLLGRERVRPKMDDERADGETEHGDGDGEKGEVVPHGDAEDARQQHLLEEDRQAEQKHAEVRQRSRAVR
jgi:hypothetical protein